MAQSNDDAEAEYHTYLGEYQFDGESWGFEVSACSWEDAERKMRQVSQGKIIGVLQGSIAVPGREHGWVAKMIGKISSVFVSLMNCVRCF